MRLYRLKIRPLSPWRTPWEADTLFGMLCCVCARTEGAAVLRRDIIEPALAGRPPFVLSDAFPAGLMPLPLWLKAAAGPAERRANIAAARWMAERDFARARRGEIPAAESLLVRSPLRTILATRRRTSRAGCEPQEVFHVREISIGPDAEAALTLYFRVAEGFADRLLGLLEHLSHTGYGAGASVGRGQFDLPEDPQPAEELDGPLPDADGVIALSTFQPAEHDPATGAWEAYVKEPRVGPDLGLDRTACRKLPVLMLRPGACFSSSRPAPFLGRAIPMDQVLDAQAARDLRTRGIELIHPAFGLTIPARVHLADRPRQ